MSSLWSVVGRVHLADVNMSTAGHPAQSSQIPPALTWALIFPDCLLSTTTTLATTLARPLFHSSMTLAKNTSRSPLSLSLASLPAVHSLCLLSAVKIQIINAHKMYKNV